MSGKIELMKMVHQIIEGNMEPVLQGSLQVTIHGRNFTKPFDPRNLSDWTLSGLSDIYLPKSYTRSIVSNEMLSQLKNMYSSLNPNLSLQNTSFNTACKKFSTDI